MDIEKLKNQAGDAIDKVASDPTAKAAANKAIEEVEKKVKVDLPDVDAIKNVLK